MSVLENPRHEIFAREVAKGKSQREAYRAAGYEGADDSVDANAARLIGDDRVAIRVQEIQQAAAKRAEITIERTLLELAKIGFADIRQAVKWGEGVAIKDPDGGEPVIANGISLVNSEELADDTAAAIAEVRQTKEGLSVKFHDKLGALEKIGKHLGMFPNKVELTGKEGGPLQAVNMSAAEFEATARKVAGEI